MTTQPQKQHSGVYWCDNCVKDFVIEDADFRPGFCMYCGDVLRHVPFVAIEAEPDPTKESPAPASSSFTAKEIVVLALVSAALMAAFGFGIALLLVIFE